MKNKDESLSRHKVKKKTRPPMKRKAVFQKHISFDYIRNIHREEYKEAAAKEHLQTKAYLDSFTLSSIKSKIKSYKNFYEQLGLEEPNSEMDKIYRSISGISKDVLITDKATTLYEMLKRNRNETPKGRKEIALEIERLHKLAYEYEIERLNKVVNEYILERLHKFAVEHKLERLHKFAVEHELNHFNYQNYTSSDILIEAIITQLQTFNYCIDRILEEICKAHYEGSVNDRPDLSVIIREIMLYQSALHQSAYVLDRRKHKRQENPYLDFYIFYRNHHLLGICELKVLELQDLYLFDDECFVNFNLPISKKEKYTLCDIAMNYWYMIGKYDENRCSHCIQAHDKCTCKIYNGMQDLFIKISYLQEFREGRGYKFPNVTIPLACYVYYRGKHKIEQKNRLTLTNLKPLPADEIYLAENLGAIINTAPSENGVTAKGNERMEECLFRRIVHVLGIKTYKNDSSLKALQGYVSFVDKRLAYLFENFTQEPVFDLIGYLLYSAESILRQFKGDLPEDPTMDIIILLEQFKD